jgi:hypothetical protein
MTLDQQVNQFLAANPSATTNDVMIHIHSLRPAWVSMKQDVEAAIERCSVPRKP